MSERGVFAVDRGIFEHERFADEPFTEREAWVWMIGEAAYRPHSRRIGKLRVELARGQLAHSTRFMAEKWKWSEASVRRFLTRLKGSPPKIDAMIDAATDAGITVITINNYSAYQRVSLPNDAATDAPNDAAATQQRRKEEGLEYREKNESGTRARPVENNPEKPPDAEQPSPIVQAVFIAGALLESAKRARDDPLAPSLSYKVQAWLSVGCTEEFILSCGSAVIGRKAKFPHLNYLDAAIRDGWIDQLGKLKSQGTAHVQTDRHRGQPGGGTSLASIGAQLRRRSG
jgi:hypothetical protein